jgi:hypothetical protein
VRTRCDRSERALPAGRVALIDEQPRALGASDNRDVDPVRRELRGHDLQARVTEDERLVRIFDLRQLERFVAVERRAVRHQGAQHRGILLVGIDRRIGDERRRSSKQAKTPVEGTLIEDAVEMRPVPPDQIGGGEQAERRHDNPAPPARDQIE